MGEKRARKSDGTTTVFRGNQIVGNLPAKQALSPISGDAVGSLSLPSQENSPPNIDSVYSLFTDQYDSESLEAAQEEFQSWVLSAAFASEEDSSRGKYWEGATRYATTPEGRAALERIVSNSETTESLRIAADVMLAEVERYSDDIRKSWIVNPEQLENQQPLAEAAIGPDVYVSLDSKTQLSPDTKVLGNSEVAYESETMGSVTVHDSILHGAHVTDSLIEKSSLQHASVANSQIADATISYQKDASPAENERFRTSVSGSTIGPGADIRGATIDKSTVLGEVIGTGAKKAGLADSRSLDGIYEVFTNGLGEEVSERARTKLGEVAEEATHARVISSVVGRGSKVRNSHLDHVVLSDGVGVDTAVIENSTLEGTSHVAGSFIHERKKLRGYTMLQQITPRDRRARVANVKLTREYVGEAAEVTKQSHVESVTGDGVLVTRYRTRFRTRARRAVWAYTITTVDPRTGSLLREFVGYDFGKNASPKVQKLKNSF